VRQSERERERERERETVGKHTNTEQGYTRTE